MQGDKAAQDMMKGGDKDWMPGPLPGGAANWGNGYYPAGRGGVGGDGKAFAFILSVEKMFNMTWYILNQATLDRGPSGPLAVQALAEKAQECLGIDPAKADVASMVKAGNTWASARSGEWDILESPMFGPFPKGSASKEDVDYLRLYSNTSTNEGSVGGFMQWSVGPDGKQAGGWFSTKFFTADGPEDVGVPRVFFCIIDRNGTTCFQIPTGDGHPAYWPGISRTRAAPTLPGTFDKKQHTPGTGACAATDSFCGVFMPACNTDDPQLLGDYKCAIFNGTGRDAGFCGSFANGLPSSHNVWGSTPALDGVQVEWTKEMLS